MTASGTIPRSTHTSRTASNYVILAGAIGSSALTVRAGGPTAPRVLMVLMAIWVLMPFVLLYALSVRSLRWARTTGVAIQCLAWLVTAVCLAEYGVKALRPAGSPAAFVFVALPPAACVVVVLTVATAALLARH